MVSFRGQKKVGSCPCWSPLGFNSKFPRSIPAPFIWESPLGGLYTNIHCLEEAFETLLEKMKHDTDVLEEAFALQLELVFFRAYIFHVVLQLYVFVKLSRNQSEANLLFSVLQDLIHDSFSIACSQFLIHTGIEIRESSQELRLATYCQLTFERYCRRSKNKEKCFIFIIFLLTTK